MPFVPAYVREIISSLILAAAQSQIFRQEIPSPVASVCVAGSFSLMYYFYRAGILFNRNRNNAPNIIRRSVSESESRRTIRRRNRRGMRRVRIRSAPSLPPSRPIGDYNDPSLNFVRPLPRNFRRNST